MRVLAALLIASPLLTACALVQEKTIGESLDETSAGTQIKTRLLAAGGVTNYGAADVVVANRLALLVGRVPSEEMRAHAERVAWTVSTVDEVANELVVDGRDLLRDINDPWIASRIRAQIVADPLITGINYNIHVYDGVVYLLGFARNQDELVAAADHASRVRGVKKVISYVKIREKGAMTANAAAPQEGAVAPPLNETQTPAPVYAPERPPTQRPAYQDPYAPGSAPPPGADGSAPPARNTTIESGPIPLVR